MGSLLDFTEEVRENKESSSRKAYYNKEIMEKDKNQGVKWKDFTQSH